MRLQWLPPCLVVLCACAAAQERPPLPASWHGALVSGFPGLPPDAREVAERAAGCLHFAGEINGDGGERDREVASRMVELRCDTIDADIDGMRGRYADDAYVRRAFELVSEAP